MRGARALCGLAVAATLVGPASAHADSVRLYEHINQQGYSFVPANIDGYFPRDLFPCGLASGCKSFNDRVSSLHVPAYRCVILYEDIRMLGASVTYCAKNTFPSGAAVDYNLDSRWNDRASSSFTYEDVYY